MTGSLDSLPESHNEARAVLTPSLVVSGVVTANVDDITLDCTIP
jgi:hypothetical protein